MNDLTNIFKALKKEFPALEISKKFESYGDGYVDNEIVISGEYSSIIIDASGVDISYQVIANSIDGLKPLFACSEPANAWGWDDDIDKALGFVRDNQKFLHGAGLFSFKAPSKEEEYVY